MSRTALPDPNLYIFDLVEKLNGSLTPFTFTADIDKDTPLSTTSTGDSQSALTAENLQALDEPAQSGYNCSSCGPLAQTDQSLQNHYKSDYHRYNMKRKLHNQPPVSEAEFERVIGELDDSISGSDDASDEESDSESKDETALNTLMNRTGLSEPANSYDDDSSPASLNHTPYLMFTSKDLADDKVYAFYKNFFDSKYTGNVYRSPEDDAKNSLEALADLDPNGTSAIFMLGGGHFSGGIFSHQRNSKQKPTHQNPFADMEVVASKSFHRYTTRRKQGGAQSANDNAKGKANSAGSSLRRANEAALEKEIRELLHSWKDELSKVSSIYIRASGPHNKSILMNYTGAPIVHNDPRIKTIPFTTRRATASEVKRAWSELSHARVENKPKIAKKENKTPEQQQKKPISDSKPKELDPNEVHSKEICALIKKSKIAGLIAYMKKNKLAADFELVPSDAFSHTPTPLHYAASKGVPNMVNTLLKTLKANPTLVNKTGKTAFQVSADRATRDAFQLARTTMGESAWDWDKQAHVGRALTESDISARVAKEKAQLLQEREQSLKELEAAEAKRSENNMDKKFSIMGGKKLSSSVATSVNKPGAGLMEMSPEERQKLERERRARAIEARLGIKN